MRRGRALRARSALLAFAALGLVLSACSRAPASAAGPSARPRTTGGPAASPPAASPSVPSPIPSPSPSPTRRKPRVNPGTLPQTNALPSATDRRFRKRMAHLWRGIVTDSLRAAMPAFFPRAAYLQVKSIPDPAADFRDRLIAAYRLDIAAAHALVGPGAGHARLIGVAVPREWAWIPPGVCENGVGYWHAPGSRLVYREGGQVRSFGIFSLISWRGQWYVVHLAVNGQPGTVDAPSPGPGIPGPPGGC